MSQEREQSCGFGRHFIFRKLCVMDTRIGRPSGHLPNLRVQLQHMSVSWDTEPGHNSHTISRRLNIVERGNGGKWCISRSKA